MADSDSWINATAPGVTPKITSIYDFSAEALGQLKVWIEQAGLNIPVNQVIGFKQQQRIYERRGETVDVNTTTTEKSLYDGSTASATTGFPINAGDMGIDKQLRLTMIGDYLHNNGAGDNSTIRVKFGGTTFCEFNGLGGSASANRQPWHMYLHLTNVGSSNSQMIAGTFSSPVPNLSAMAIGIGNPAAASTATHPDFGIATLGTIDTSVATKLDVTIQWSVSSANNSWRRRNAILELI